MRVRASHFAMFFGISIGHSIGVLCLIVAAFSLQVRADDALSGTLTFEKDIRPILRAHCLDCHGATDDLKGGLDLRQVRLMLKGGDSGPAIKTGHADESLLMARIASGEMPPGEAKVTPHEREILTQWLAQGAPTARPEPETIRRALALLRKSEPSGRFSRSFVRPSLC